MKVRPGFVWSIFGLIGLLFVLGSAGAATPEDSTPNVDTTPAAHAEAPAPAPVAAPPAPAPAQPQIRSECTSDCSGHDAGYEWAQTHDITDTEYDNGNSESFNEGVRQYAEENQ